MTTTDIRQKVLILTQYSLPENKRNMNAYQRIFYGADHADIKLLIRSKATVSEEIFARVSVHSAPVNNRVLFMLYAVLYAGFVRLYGWRIILTDPSGYAYVGFVAKFLFGYHWAMDLWDRPRWRAGAHEAGTRQPLGDRILFKVMRMADLFILSVLPPAVKDINPLPQRCVQFTNAIAMENVADSPPSRRDDDDTLHLAFGKSIFDETVGLGIVQEAAEILVQRGVPFHVHTVGEVTQKVREAIMISPAASHFTLHGFIKQFRAEFYHSVHVGLTPYMDYEDLSYIYPIKVLEHLSQGNPVIATDLPGLSVMVRDGENGFLVKPNDPVALADAIESLQSDRSLYDRMATDALASIRQFDAREKNLGIYTALRERFCS